MSGHARQGKLKLADLKGGCFTISSLERGLVERPLPP